MAIPTQKQISFTPPMDGYNCFVTILPAMLKSMLAKRAGSVRPGDIQDGEEWLDISASPVWTTKLWDGTQDIILGSFNISSHTYSPAPSNIPTAAATGTVVAITATFSPAITLTDKLVVALTALGANTSTTPTFNPNGLGAKTITRRGNQPLAPGDIPGANSMILLMYNAGTTKWELLNPATVQEPWVVAGGTADVLTATYAPAIPALYDGLCVSLRAASANATTTPTLNVNGLGAKTITKYGGSPLAAGDIAGAGAELILVYKLANTRWELLNPALPSSIALRDTQQSYTKTHYSAPLAITSTTNATSFDNSTCALATLALGENTTVGIPTNMADGQAGELQVTPSGSYTIAFNSSGWAMFDDSAISVTLTSGKMTRILWRNYNGKNRIYRVM